MLAVSRRLVLRTISILCLIGGILVASAPVADAHSGYTRGDMGDPDTLYAAGSYYTYATNGQIPSGCYLSGLQLKVPYIKSAVGTPTSLANVCPTGDALPNIGTWAYRGGCAQVWAPSVERIGSRYVMYYAASKAGTGASCTSVGQMCIGKNSQARQRGPSQMQASSRARATGSGRLIPTCLSIRQEFLGWFTGTTTLPTQVVVPFL